MNAKQGNFPANKFVQDKVKDIKQTGRKMAQKINAALASLPSPFIQEKKIIRLKIQIPDQPLLPWLKNQDFSLKTYWSDRKKTFEVAGVGAADYVDDDNEDNYVKVFERLRKYLDRSEPDVRYYGGFTFAPQRASDNIWQRFGRHYFVLPRFELYKSEDKTFFVCNLCADVDRFNIAAIMTQLESITFKNDTISDSIPNIVSEQDFPEKQRWKTIVQSALDAFKACQCEKLVLARKTALEFSDNLNHFIILQKLKETALNSYKFCFQPAKNIAFIGASPELLYHRNGKKLQSEAIAGTRTRGKSKQEDLRFGQELLQSEKDRREHQYVIESMKNAFKSLAPAALNCNNVSVSLLKLACIQHLIARFNLEIKENISDAKLIAALHPSAAVGGYPKHKALIEIGRLENFDRGWYAAPVGWVKTDAAEFVVAIRSGLVTDNTLTLYSGAGIVCGSVPDNEWKEMDNKIDNFLSVLT